MWIFIWIHRCWKPFLQKGLIKLTATLLLVTGYCYGVVSYKASHALQPFSDPLCVPIWVLIIPDPSTRVLWQIIAETPRNLARNIGYFCRRSVSVILSRDTWYAVKSYVMRLTAFLPLRSKACCRFSSQIQIYRSRPRFNPRTLGPVASTLAITPPRTTKRSLGWRRRGWKESSNIKINSTGLQLGDHELASGDWREGEVLFPL
jgi:hypothetical protein